MSEESKTILSFDTIKLAVDIIGVCCQRGALKAEEMEIVGKTYNEMKNVVNQMIKLNESKEEVENQTELNESTEEVKNQTELNESTEEVENPTSSENNVESELEEKVI